MRRFSSPLDKVTVAAPCPAGWDEMIGDYRVRFCRQCELNVYNLSAMSKHEAESLIARTEGRLCVRFYRRRDGSILTDNCPIGLRALKRRASRIKRAVASSILGFLAGIGGSAAADTVGSYLIARLPPPYGHTQQGMIALKPTPSPEPRMIMGDMAPIRPRRDSQNQPFSKRRSRR